MKLFAQFQITGHGPRAGERLDFPKLRALAIIFLVSAERVDEQAFFAIGPQPRVGMKHNPLLRPARHQFHHLHRQPLQFRQFLRLRVRHKQNVQVGTVINFAAAEFAEADDDQRRLS